VQIGPGVKLTFYRGRGSAGEAATGSNRWLNGLKAIHGRRWLSRGISPGVKAGRQYLEVPKEAGFGGGMARLNSAKGGREGRQTGPAWW
jgi:hypothetical protein